MAGARARASVLAAFPSSHPRIALVCLLWACSAHAAWLPGGTPVCTQAGVQEIRGLAPDGAGGAYFVWSDAAQGNDLVVGRLSSSGDVATGWPGQGRLVASTPSSRTLTAAGADGAGGIDIAWLLPSYEPRGIRLDPTGAAVAGWVADGNPLPTVDPVSGGVGTAYGRTATVDGLGGFWVTFGWSFGSYPSASSQQGIGHVLADASNGGSAGVIGSSFPQGTQVIPVAGESGHVLLNLSGAEYGFTQLLQLRSSPSTITWSVGPVDASLGASDGAGGAYLFTNGDVATTHVSRLDASGATAPGWPAAGIPVRSGDIATHSPSNDFDDFRSDGSGGVLVLWWEDGPDGSVLRVQRFVGSGTIAPGWPVDGRVIGGAAGKASIHMCPDGHGGAFIAWTDTRSDADGDVYAGHVLANGVMDPALGLDGALISGGAGRQALGDIIDVAPGEAILAWTDDRAGASNSDVYAQKLVDQTASVTDPPLRHDTLIGFTPNPSHSVPTVSFTLASGGTGTLDVLDLQGRRVAGVDVSRFGPGEHRLRLDGVRLAPGRYVIRLAAGGRVTTRAGLVVP